MFPSSQDATRFEIDWIFPPAGFHSFRPSPYYDYDYEGAVYNVVSPKHPTRFGPVTREEHDLQLWYNGGGRLPGEEPRQHRRREPQNLLGKSYEEYKQLYFLPEHVLTSGPRQGNRRDRPRLEEEGENQTLNEPRQLFSEERDGDATAVAEEQLGPRNADVVERRQGIVGTGRILRATALAVS